jgi:hypothetical protein
LVAGGPVAAPESGDVAVPHRRPIPIWGYWDDPAMPRDASTPLEGRYTDNDSWSTNELGIDWLGVTFTTRTLEGQWRCEARRFADAMTPVPVTAWLGRSSGARVLGVAANPERGQILDSADVFERGGNGGSSTSGIDVKSLHAKIGELVLENDFLQRALGKAGLVSAKR